MKKLLLSVILLLTFLQIANAVTPVLSANATQICFDGTTYPLLNVVAGSGKSTYVGSVINDPTDPIAIKGIYFTATSATGFTLTSNTQSVVKDADISMTLEASTGFYILKIKPSGIGYATVSVTATNGSSNSSTYKVYIAASSASAYGANTIFPTLTSNASAVALIDDNYMFVGDDEFNVIRMYSKKVSGQPLYSVDITTASGGASGDEFDLEAATVSSSAYNGGRRIYWIGSEGNTSSGNLAPTRARIIATDMSGTGAGTTLTVKSYFDNMRSTLTSWGDNCSWNFTASGAKGMAPKQLDGFNIEGLTLTNAGGSAYIGFRAPCVPLKGTTPASNNSNRLYAVVAPVTNFEDMMNVSGNSSVTPVMGEPILFDFGGLGIRDMVRVGGNKYVIIAGLYQGGGTPAIYLWDGVVPSNPGLNPITTATSSLIKLPLNLTDLIHVQTDASINGHPEAITAEQIGNYLYIHVICDDGSVIWYNDGTAAKDLTNPEFAKYRQDTYVYSLTGDPVLQLTSTATSTTQTINAGSPISNITYIWGGAATGVTVSGLPTGVTTTINTPGQNVFISGTPTVSGTFNYTVTTTQASGTAVVLTGTIDVTPVVAPTLVLTSGSDAQSVVQGTAISSIVYSYGGGATDVNVTGLPAGFTATKDAIAKTIIISGSSASVLPTTTYTLTTVGTTPAVTLTGTITVTADPNAAAMSNSGGSLSQTVVPGVAITPIVLTWAGGSTGINVTNLPAGLTAANDMVAKTVTIMGTPTATGTYTATTVGGTLTPVTLTGTITVGSSSTETFESLTSTNLSTGSDKTQALPINGQTWNVISTRLNTSATYANGGNNSLRMLYGTGALITPLLQGTQTVSFYVKVSSATVTTSVQVFLSTDGGTTYGGTAIKTVALTGASYVLVSVPLTETSNNVKLKILNAGGSSQSSSYNVYIDDVTYTPASGTPTAYKEANNNIDIHLIQTANDLTIKGAEVSQLSICDLTGKSLVNNIASQSINIGSLCKGIYIILIETKDGTIASEKFIKR